MVDATESEQIYPPIHDQIDTPTDFSVAVRKRGKGETATGHKEKQRRRDKQTAE